MLLSALLSAAALAAPALAGFDNVQLQLSGTTVCLDNRDGRLAPGNVVYLWECNGGENQRWTRGRGGQVQLAAHPGWCLGQEPLPGGTYSGSLVLQECSDGAAHMLDEIDGKLCEYAKSNVNDPDNCIAARDNRGYGGRMVFRSGGGDKFNYV